MPEPQSSTSTSNAEDLRVELRSGGQLMVYDARVLGDSLVGQLAPPSAASRARIAIATSDVRRVSKKKFSLGRTVLAVTTIGLATLVIAGVSTASSSTPSSNSSCALAAPAPTPPA
jgi:hypothetical protein